MNIPAFYAEVRAVETKLNVSFQDGYCFVTSLKNSGLNSTAGNTCEVTTENAALGIVNQTKRLATAEEIATYHKIGEENAFLANAVKLRQDGSVKVIMSMSRRSSRE